MMTDLEDIVAHQKRVATRRYNMLARREARQVDGDDSVIVEGDGEGKSSTMALFEARLKPVS
jgi:hypothetical protein